MPCRPLWCLCLAPAGAPGLLPKPYFPHAVVCQVGHLHFSYDLRDADMSVPAKFDVLFRGSGSLQGLATSCTMVRPVSTRCPGVPCSGSIRYWAGSSGLSCWDQGAGTSGDDVLRTGSGRPASGSVC